MTARSEHRDQWQPPVQPAPQRIAPLRRPRPRSRNAATAILAAGLVLVLVGLLAVVGAP